MVRKQSSCGWRFAFLLLFILAGCPSLLYGGYLRSTLGLSQSAPSLTLPTESSTAVRRTIKQPIRKTVTGSTAANKVAAVRYAPAPITVPVASIPKTKASATKTVKTTVARTTTQASVLAAQAATAAALTTSIGPSDLSIAGFSFLDTNKNGRLDKGEWSIGNALVQLVPQSNPSTYLTTYTKADGSYRFGALDPAERYSIVQYNADGSLTSTGATIGRFVDAYGNTMPKAYFGEGTIRPNWYGSATSFDRVDGVYLPTKSELGWDSTAPNYSVVDYNFGDYKLIDIPASKRYYLLSSKQTIWVPTIDVPTVPEPATFAMLLIGGVGLAGIGWVRRRRRA